MSVPESIAFNTTVEEQVWEELEASILNLKQAQRTIRDRVNEVRLSQKPDFPTAEQREGILNAVLRFKDGYEAKSHHGDPCGPEREPSVVAYAQHGADGWMSIRHGAPFRYKMFDGSLLWKFTEEEIGAMLALVEDMGGRVVNHWPHGEGVSIVFTADRFSKEEQA